MQDRQRCGGGPRREFLIAAGGAPAPPPATSVSAQEKTPATTAGPLGIPGPYPGRVIEARNPAMIRGGVKDRAAIRATLDRGLKELTGADDAVGAWKTFVEPGDVVGIKVVPNGF